jgi:phosphate transport system permease protein
VPRPLTTTLDEGRAGDGPAPRRQIVDEPTRVDRLFNRLTTAAGLSVFVILGLVGIFLLLRGWQAFQLMGPSFFTTTQFRTDTNPPQLGVLGLLSGTVIVAIIAVVIAIPLGVCAAVFITDYAGRRMRGMLTNIVDLLAAIPSLLFGIWGFLYLGAQIAPLSQFLADHFGWIPFFATSDHANFTGSMFIAGIVVSLMVLPIIASVGREVFAQTPPAEKEAALALGGTRWAMVRTVVLPFGKGGIVGASMLGLGRALGETIAVSLLLPQVPAITGRILENGGATISGFIALRAGGDDITVSGLMAAAAVLFIMTLATNIGASFVVARSRSGAGVEA